MSLFRKFRTRGTQSAPEPETDRLPRGARDSWKDWFRHATERRGARRVLTTHPRFKAIAADFSIGAYLKSNPDVGEVTAGPEEALFHYLEFGLDEGRTASADRWDPDFVARLTGLHLAPQLDAAAAATALRSKGFEPFDIALCERDLWFVNGVHGGVFEEVFHHEYYLAALSEEPGPLPAPDRLSCIQHYVEKGLHKGIAPHPDHILDHDFYAAFRRDKGLPAPESDQSVAAHWAWTGLFNDCHANPKSWAGRKYGLLWPKDVSDAMLTGRPQDIPKTLNLLLTHPLPITRRLSAAKPSHRQFMIDLARLLRAQGKEQHALVLLDRTFEAAPDLPRVRVDLADLMHQMGEPDREYDLRLGVPADFDNGANRLALARLCIRKNRLEEALHLIATLPAIAKRYPLVQAHARTLGRHVFAKMWENLSAQIDANGVDATKAMLTNVIRLYAPFAEGAPPVRKVQRIAILANSDLKQCMLYRASQTLEQLRTAGLDADLFTQTDGIKALGRELSRYDAVIFQRTPAFPSTAALIVEARAQGIITFFEVDDLIFDPAHFPPPLSSYQGQIDARLHERIACGVPLFEACARLCDYGIASTETIQEALAPLTRSGKAFLHPNALGYAHEAAIARNKRPSATNEKVVLFYGSGTKAHKEEFSKLLEPALAQVLATRRDQIEIRLMGDFPEFTSLDPDDPAIHVSPPIWDFETYASELAQADISLSVLSPSLAADAKSEIKWLEAAMFAIPTVTSPTKRMRAVIKDGETGLFATNVEEFTRQIKRLIDDDNLRRSIGEAAARRVAANYARGVMSKRLASLLRELEQPPQKTKPKVLIANVFYPPQDIGGATRVVADNVAHLTDRYADEFDIEILTTLDGGMTPFELSRRYENNVRVWSISPERRCDDTTIRPVGVEHRIGTVLDEVKPDLVHIHCIQRLGVGLIDQCRQRNIPYIVTLHDGWWLSKNQFVTDHSGQSQLYNLSPEMRRSQPERARIAGQCLDGAAAILAVSEEFAALCRQCGLSKVQAVPNGVSALAEPKRRPPTTGIVRLGHIGGATRHKGFELIRAVLHTSALPNLHLTFIDHGLPAGSEINEMWSATPVRRLAPVAQAQIGDLLGQFDVLLAPSIWPESFGLVTREALRSGLWVVASDRGAIGSDIVEGKNGFIVSVDDHRALLSTLEAINNAPQTFNRLPDQETKLRPATDQGDELATIYREILSGRA